jgi:hypothetical protein
VLLVSNSIDKLSRSGSATAGLPTERWPAIPHRRFLTRTPTARGAQARSTWHAGNCFEDQVNRPGIVASTDRVEVSAVVLV